MVSVRSRHTGASLTPFTVTATFAAAERGPVVGAVGEVAVRRVLLAAVETFEVAVWVEAQLPGEDARGALAGCVTVYVSGSMSTSVQSGAVESAGPSSETVTATFSHTGASFTPVIVTATFAVFESPSRHLPGR